MGGNNETQRASISQARSYEEMAEFWDTHDTADYWDEFEEVTVEMRAPRHRNVSIEPAMYEVIRAEARRRGVLPETLVNVWLAEKVWGLPTPATAGSGEAEAEGAEEKVKG